MSVGVRSGSQRIANRGYPTTAYDIFREADWPVEAAGGHGVAGDGFAPRFLCVVDCPRMADGSVYARPRAPEKTRHVCREFSEPRGNAPARSFAPRTAAMGSLGWDMEKLLLRHVCRVFGNLREVKKADPRGNSASP